MDKKCVGDIEYVKPQALDLGALTIMYGSCRDGSVATPTSGGDSDCNPSGGFATGGGDPAYCPAGSAAACGTGGTAAT